MTNRRCSDAKIDTLLETQFGAGRLYAAVSSRPGQVGRADGYILEGKELEVGFKFGCGRCVVHRSELMMMSDYPVLLEEIADGEAEARVVIYRASEPFRSWAVSPVVVVPWTRERWLLTFSHLVGMCCYCESSLMKMIHVSSFPLFLSSFSFSFCFVLSFQKL